MSAEIEPGGLSLLTAVFEGAVHSTRVAGRSFHRGGLREVVCATHQTQHGPGGAGDH